MLFHVLQHGNLGFVVCFFFLWKMGTANFVVLTNKVICDSMFTAKIKMFLCICVGCYVISKPVIINLENINHTLHRSSVDL